MSQRPGWWDEVSMGQRPHTWDEPNEPQIKPAQEQSPWDSDQNGWQRFMDWLRGLDDEAWGPTKSSYEKYLTEVEAKARELQALYPSQTIHMEDQSEGGFSYVIDGLSFPQALEMAAKAVPPPEGLLEENIPYAEYIPFVGTILRGNAYEAAGREMPQEELSIRLAVDLASVVAPWAIGKALKPKLPVKVSGRTTPTWDPVTGVRYVVPEGRITYLAEEAGKVNKLVTQLEKDLAWRGGAAGWPVDPMVSPQLTAARQRLHALDTELLELLQGQGELKPVLVKQIEKLSGLKGMGQASDDVARTATSCNRHGRTTTPHPRAR